MLFLLMPGASPEGSVALTFSFAWQKFPSLYIFMGCTTAIIWVKDSENNSRKEKF